MALKHTKISREKISSTRIKKNLLTAGEIRHFKDLLLKKRQELLENVTEFEDEALKKSRLESSGDLSSMPIHMADLGSDNFEQEFALGLMDSERKVLREIDEALERIDKGIYGICMGTGKSISKDRLEAEPWTRYSVEYAEKLEKGKVE
jgi:DnaK suppressor protein